MADGAYYVVFTKPGDTLSAIVRDTLGPFPSDREWMDTVREVARRSGIADPDHIQPGQPVILRRAASPAHETHVPEIQPEEIERLRRIWKETPPQQRELVEQHWDLLDWINLGNNGTGGMAGAGVAVAQVELSGLRPPPPEVQIALRQRIQSVSVQLIEIRNRTISTLRREQVTRTTRAVIRLTPDTLGQARYATRLRALTATARGLSLLAKGSLGISIGLAGVAIYSDWNTPMQNRTLATQLGGLGGAMLGGSAGYGVCNVALGFPTGGNSLWICALIVGAGAGVGFGELGAFATGTVHDLVVGPQPSEGEAGSSSSAWALERFPLPALR